MSIITSVIHSTEFFPTISTFSRLFFSKYPYNLGRSPLPRLILVTSRRPLHLLGLPCPVKVQRNILIQLIRDFQHVTYLVFIKLKLSLPTLGLMNITVHFLFTPRPLCLNLKLMEKIFKLTHPFPTGIDPSLIPDSPLKISSSTGESLHPFGS